MASGNWYFTRLGQQHGPILLDALQSMARSGELRPDELVWTEGMANWVPAGTVALLLAPTSPVVDAPAGGIPAPQAVGVIGYYTPTNQFIYAGFWLRFCAIFIDGIVLGIPMAATMLAIELGAPPVNYFQNRPPLIVDLAPLVANLMSILGGWLYFGLMESSSYQATLGKRLVGLQVIDMTGARITFGRATGRFFGKILSYMTFYIGFIMAAFTNKRQALHDIMAGTLVIKKSP